MLSVCAHSLLINLNLKTPACVNRINLERDNQLVIDLCASPCEPDALALVKANGVVQVISELVEKQAKVVAKPLDALCSKRNLLYL